MMRFTYGCDPEFFLFDTRANMYVYAGYHLPGDKNKPHPLQLGAVQVDGVAGEFNINPVETEDQWLLAIEHVIQQIKEMLPGHIEMRFEPAVTFDPNYYNALPDECKIVGCDPDYQAWSNNPAVPREPPVVEGERYGAGHIHIGWNLEEEDLPVKGDATHLQDCVHVVKQLDGFLNPLTYHEYESCGRLARYDTYGMPGLFRVKPYGVEYRTPSNHWVKERKTRRDMFRFAQRAVYQLDNGVYAGNDSSPLINNNLRVLHTSNTDQLAGDPIRRMSNEVRYLYFGDHGDLYDTVKNYYTRR